jgi:hypothetical protein
MGLPLEHITVNRLFNTLFICATLGSFIYFTWNGSSHFHLMPQTIMFGPSVSLYHI